MNDFERISPDSAGVSRDMLDSFFYDLDNMPFDMHSVLMMRGGKLFAEVYYEPFKRESIHRLFSVAKSFVSLAVLSLYEEGRIDIDKPITDYFPEYPTQYEYIKKTNIRNMLMMRTPHAKTTYKTDLEGNWVKSYFTVKPSHIPGTVFAYDTSSPHVLSRLVEKISGLPLLDYLRKKFLDEIGFSKEAYFLKDPQGVSQGGSGLMATPMDLMSVAFFLMNGGKWQEESLMDEKLIRLATSYLTPTDTRGSFTDEKQGYGMMFWRTQNNGFMMYGLGGQLAVCVPQKDLILVTTADTLECKGGVQNIMDAFWRNIYDKIGDMKRLDGECYTKKRKIMPVAGIGRVFEGEYTFEDNALSLKYLRVTTDMNGGVITYTNNTGTHSLKYKTGGFVSGKFPYYGCDSITSGGWTGDDLLKIKSRLIGEMVGSVTMEMYFTDYGVTISSRKTEETYFNEFSGIVQGTKKERLLQ